MALPAVGLAVTATAWQRALYSLLLYCALPFAAAWVLWRGWRSPANRDDIRARLGLAIPASGDRPIWVHAASVGEVRSLAALLPALRRAGHSVLLTVGTPTGLAQARAFYPVLSTEGSGRPGLRILAAPWDLPGATRRFLDATGPRAGLLVETELWPNLVAAARRRGIPLGMASARLSQRSLARYLRWAPALMRQGIRSFAMIAAQTEADRQRFIRLGADADSVAVAGNLKSELELPADIGARAGSLRARWLGARPAWIAGSTHAGEEAICLAAHRRVMAARPAAPAPLLVLAPRHPQRFGEVARELAAAGWSFARSSVPAAAPAAIEVLLVDEMGSLLAWYAAGDVAFVGGSLVPAGGHNLLEPARLAKPVLAGPHDASAPEIAQRLRDAGGLRSVRDAQDLADAVLALLDDPEAARLQGDRAAAAATPVDSPSRRTLALLDRLLAAP